MTPRTADIVVKATELPKVVALYSAAHRVLVERLLPPHEISTEAWNELTAAHDDMTPEETP